VTLEWIFVMTMFFLEIAGVSLNQNLKFCRVAGYSKAAITFVKYMPQVYLNWKRKSTVGWSITNILLDFTGGSLSFLQQILDSLVNGTSLFGDDGFNIVKFMLSIMSIVFDVIFMF
jgi:cystinosin